MRMNECLSVKPPTAESEEEDTTSSSSSSSSSNSQEQQGAEAEAKEININKDTLYKFMTYIRDVKIANDPIKRLLGPVHEQARTTPNPYTLTRKA